MASSRNDKRGHWPAGKRRSRAPLPEPIRKAIEQRLDDGISCRTLARELQLSDRTLRRWLSGEAWPSQKSLAALYEIGKI